MEAKRDPRRAVYESNELEHVLGLLAYHISLVAREPAPTVIRCGLSGPTREIRLRVTIEPGGKLAKEEGIVWDQCHIALASDDEDVKGDWVGNRCGAAKVVAQLYADVIEEVAKAEEAA
jgi:hypothetical protein